MITRMLLPLVGVLCSTVISAGEGPQIGVLWASKSSMADRVFAGFSQVMAAKAPEVQIEVRSNLKDDAEAAKIYAEWQGSKKAVIFLRSAASKAILENAPKIPCFVGACNNPMELGLVKSLDAPEGMVTGVTYYIPYKLHLDTYRSIWPDVKKVGILLAQGHPSAPIEEKGTKDAAAPLGIEVLTHWCKVKNDVAIGTKALVDAGAQLVIVANQALIFDNAASIGSAAGTVPVVSYADKPIAAKQVVGGLGVDDYLLGQKLGESVVKVVVQGTAIKDTPIAVDPTPRLRLVMEKVRALNIQVPEAVLAKATKVE